MTTGCQDQTLGARRQTFEARPNAREPHHETTTFNYGWPNEVDFIVFNEPDKSYKTAWVHWPEKYKFISLQININDEQKILQRESKDWLAALGDVGGILSILEAVIMCFVGFFA